MCNCALLVRYKRSYPILFYLCKIFVALCVNESIQEAIIGLDTLMRAQGLGLPLITPHHARESSLNYGDYPMAWSIDEEMFTEPLKDQVWGACHPL